MDGGRQRAIGGLLPYTPGPHFTNAHILGYVASSIDRRAIADALPAGARVRWCEDATDLLRRLDDHGVAALIVELHADGQTPLDGILAALEARSVPVLLRFDLTPRTARQIAGLQGTSLDIRLSLRGFDVLNTAIGHLLSSATFGLPELAVVSRLAEHAGPRVLDVVVGASVIGASNATVGDLARFCASSTRRLEERLFQEQLPHPKRLLMWVLCVFTIWRVERLKWSAHDAAVRAGFSSADVLSKRLARLTGMRLSVLVKHMSFEQALDRFSAELAGLPVPRTESS